MITQSERNASFTAAMDILCREHANYADDPSPANKFKRDGMMSLAMELGAMPVTPELKVLPR